MQDDPGLGAWLTAMKLISSTFSVSGFSTVSTVSSGSNHFPNSPTPAMASAASESLANEQRCVMEGGSQTDSPILTQSSPKEKHIVFVSGRIHGDEGGIISAAGQSFNYSTAGLLIVVTEDDFGASLGEILDSSCQQSINGSSAMWRCCLHRLQCRCRHLAYVISSAVCGDEARLPVNTTTLSANSENLASST